VAGQPRSVRAAVSHSEYSGTGGSTIGVRIMLPLRRAAFVALFIVSLLTALAALSILDRKLWAEPPAAKQRKPKDGPKKSALATSFARAKGAAMSEEVRLELRRALREEIAKRPVPEPLPKPERWTKLEYLLAQTKIKTWKQILDSPKEGKTSYWMKYHIFFDRDSSAAAANARELLPLSSFHWQREALLSAMKIEKQQLDNLVIPYPFLRDLKESDVRSLLSKRAPRQERQRLFKSFAAITGDQHAWSLHHPFDDLDNQQMIHAIQAARRVKDVLPKRVRGEEARPLDREDWLEDFQLLIWADQYEFLIELLVTPEEYRAAEADKERKRKAAEEAAVQQRKKEKEEDKKREIARQRQLKIDEGARQRQLKIDEEEKVAKRMLRAALLLNGRSGFDKQVRQRLQEIIDKYPDTPSAKKAQRQLDKMAK
jgi:hypothetical protein